MSLQSCIKCVVVAIGLQVASVRAQPQDLPTEKPLPFYTDKFNLLSVYNQEGALMPVESPEDWNQRRQHILAGMQQVMGPLPDISRKMPLDVQVIETEDLPSLVRKKISYQAGPRDRIPAYLLIPKNIQQPGPAMLCLHGTSGSRGRTAGVGADYPRYTLELAERGYVTIAPDYTLLGDNQTDPAALGYASGTMKGIWSHMAAVDLLSRLPEVDPQRIGCIGLSLGGHNSLFVAAFDPRLKVVVTSSGFDSFLDYMNGNPTGWCQPRYMPRIETVYGKRPEKLPFDFPEVLAVIAPRPIFIHAPQSDSNFRLDSVQRCEAAAQKVYAFLGAPGKLKAIYPPGEHGFPLEAREEAYQFIAAALSK